MKEWNFWTTLTFSWRTPLIPTEFNMEIPKSAAGGGRLFGGDTTVFREQKPESALQYLGKAFWPSAHWWSLE
jgi:hypothetical protein